MNSLFFSVTNDRFSVGITEMILLVKLVTKKIRNKEKPKIWTTAFLSHRISKFLNRIFQGKWIKNVFKMCPIRTQTLCQFSYPSCTVKQILIKICNIEFEKCFWISLLHWMILFLRSLHTNL